MSQLKRIMVSVAVLLMVMDARAALFEKKDVPVENKELEQYVPKPIPCGPDAPTTWRYKNEKVLPFYRKQVIDPFKNSPEASQPWAPEVLKMLEDACIAIGDSEFFEKAAAWKNANKLIDKGCTYPVLRWMQAMSFRQEGKMKQASDELKKMDESLAATPDQWFPKLLVGIGYRTLDSTPQSEAIFTMRLIDWVNKGGLTKDDSRHVYIMLCNLESDGSPAVLAAFEKTPSIDPWLTLMLRGEIARKEAWQMRGKGWANTVTDEGWKGFNEGITLARKSFEEAWQLHPEFPNAATKMIEICGCSGGNMRLWFDRAVAIELDRPLPYVMYVWYTRPRWGGSMEEMEAFAEACYQTQRHDTRVPLNYAIIMFQIAEELKCDPKMIFTRPDVYKKCIAVLTPQTNNTKVPQDVRDAASELLPLVEYLGGDLKKAVDYNKRRKVTTTKVARTYLPDDYLPIFYVLNGLKWKNSKFLIPAEKLYQAGRYEEALNDLRNVSTTNKMTGMELDYLIYRTHCAENQTLFRQGKWVTPTFNSLYSGWLNYGGSWGFDGKGLRTDGKKSLLEWMPPIPEDVEYEGVFHFLAPAGQDSKVCFQLDTFGDNGRPSILFAYENNKCQVAIGSRSDQPDTDFVSVACEKPEARFRIISCKNKVSVWVNDTQLVDAVDMSEYMRSFRKDGMRHLRLYGARVAISDLRLRAPDMTAIKKQP
jgi:hypothetical protein